MSNEEELDFWKMFEKKVSIRENEIVISNVIFPKINNRKILADKETKEYIEKSPFRLDYLKKDIYFENCDFHDFTLNKITFDNKVIFNNCKFFNNINFTHIIFNKELGIYDCTFFDVNLNINSQTTFNEGFRICKNKGKLNFELTLVYFSEGIFSVFVNDDLELFNLEMNSCIIYDKSYLELIGNTFNKLVLNDIKEYSSDFLIQHSTVKEKFVLNDCLFSNTRFYNLNLINCFIDASGVTLDNLLINDIKWGNLDNKFKDKYHNNKSKSNRSLFKELKNSYEKRGDIIEANKFYALEMKEREKELERDKKEDKNIFEWLVFKIHGLSSNHSQDWTLALYWILIIGATFSFINNCSGFWSLFITVIFSMIIFFCNNFNKWIKLLLFYGLYILKTGDILLHDVVKVINPFEKSSGIGLIEFLSKIIIAYLIYQLIVSIRQNTRRK